MDAVELLRKQGKHAWAWLEFTVHDVSTEQANWHPPGMANSIGAVYTHLTIGADLGFNVGLFDREPLIVSEFGREVGLSEMFPLADWHEWAQRVRIDWDALHAYGRAVHAFVEDSLDSLTPDLLERTAKSPPALGVWKGVDVFNLHGVDHVKLHGGEISCLKGLQGAEGWGLTSDLEASQKDPAMNPGEVITKQFSARP